MTDVVGGYLRLGLRLGRLVDGLVDSWYGDPALSREVAAEPTPDPRELAAQATELLAALPDSGLEADRVRFLTAQLAALRVVADRVAGVDMPFRDEVRAYFHVEVSRQDPAVYAAVHDEIAELAPGPGPLAERVADFYRRNTVPPERLGRCVQAVSDALRPRVREMFGLPDGERVDYSVVPDAPWHAFTRYVGGYRSEIALNADAGRSVAALPIVVTHEAYPGHHTEHCLREAGQVRGRGRDEHRIALVNTPQCLVSEGLGEAAATALPGPGWGEWTADLLAAEGVRVDGEAVERMRGLIVRLLPARVDAVLMLHESGATPDEAAAHLRRWMLLPPGRAEQMTRFMTDPLWRAYSVTYAEGGRLVEQWLAAGGPGDGVIDRFRTLLNEPLLPGDLRAGLDRRREVSLR